MDDVARLALGATRDNGGRTTPQSHVVRERQGLRVGPPVQQVRDALTDAWLACAPKDLAAEFLKR
jgi:hypothetical protein